MHPNNCFQCNKWNLFVLRCWTNNQDVFSGDFFHFSFSIAGKLIFSIRVSQLSAKHWHMQPILSCMARYGEGRRHVFLLWVIFIFVWIVSWKVFCHHWSTDYSTTIMSVLLNPKDNFPRCKLCQSTSGQNTPVLLKASRFTALDWPLTFAKIL